MISACLVIHNEEELLPRCLNSVKDTVDEIILVHDGECTDNSLNIANDFHCRIFIRDFIGEAEWHRPFSYNQAKGDWILQIDADEFLSEKLKTKLKKLTEAKNVDGYYFVWPYFDGINYIQKGPFAKTEKAALFRKSKMYLIGIAHEYPRSYGKIVHRQDLQLEHQPLVDNYTGQAFNNKWLRWAKLQAKQIVNVDVAPIFNISNRQVNPAFAYYKQMIKYPILNGIYETIKFLIIYFSRGLLFAGSKSWLIAYMELNYLWQVRLNLRRLKHEPK